MICVAEGEVGWWNVWDMGEWVKNEWMLGGEGVRS